MPLHDWSDDRGWDSVHHYWITNLALWLKPRLPSGFRAYLGSVPGLTIETAVGRPDVGVRRWQPEAPAVPSAAATVSATPDYQGIALAARDPQLAVHVVHHGRLVAAIELVSPRNKDRPAAREHYTNRYLGYIWDGVHLMVVDVHSRPEGFSFADAVAAALDYAQPPCPAPHAVSWNVGGVTPEGGRFLDTWQRPLAIGVDLPALPLALTAEQIITVELEPTYAQAAADAYRDQP
jgi:hypothetical protein